MKPSRVQIKAKVVATSALTFGVTALVISGVSGCATQRQSSSPSGQSSSTRQEASSSLSNQIRMTNTTNTMNTISQDESTTLPSNGGSTIGNGTPPIQQYYIDRKTYLIRPDNSSPSAVGGSNSSGTLGSSNAANTSKEKIVLLTFDDGPNGTSTREILATLNKYHAKAIWFISGYHYGPQYRPDPNKAPQFDALVLH